MSQTKNRNRRIIRHEQWIEIVRVEGRTLTMRYPSNAEFERLRLAMDPPPELIYRRLYFVHGVPAEYCWVGPTPEMQLHGGLALERITLEEWPSILTVEVDAVDGVVIPARNPVGRPEDLGPCPCVRCTEERDRGNEFRFIKN